MSIETLISRLEDQWDIDGFLGNVRQGIFSPENGRQFLALLNEIRLDDNTQIPKRLLSLLWYIPSFLEWQKERVEEKGGDKKAYERFVTEVHNTLERVLGVP